MTKKPYKFIVKYLPQFFGFIASCFLLGMTSKTFMWLKDYGDFATQKFVLEAKADCMQKAEDDLHRHEDWETGQFKQLEDKIDKIYLILIEKK